MNNSDSSRRCQSEKKSKKEKKHKKDRKHKHKKRSHRSSDNEKTEVLQKDSTELMVVAEQIQAFGPALPPHLIKTNYSNVIDAPIIGPALPQGVTLSTEGLHSGENSEVDEEVHGPLPITDSTFKTMTTAQIELEQRALEIKLAKLDPDTKTVDTNVREEWMLELPDVGLKTGIASLKRTFHSKERPDFSDRTSWTKTPNSSDVPSTSKVTETSKSKAEQLYQEARDAEQEKLAKKLKKKHKRDKSLYEIHQKKLKKEKEKKEKESNGKAERRPFSRDIDLQMNKIDKNQTKSIVDKAKFLDSRFSSGNAKYL